MLTYTPTEFGVIDVQLFMNDGDVRPKTSDEPFEERRIRRRIVELSPRHVGNRESFGGDHHPDRTLGTVDAISEIVRDGQHVIEIRSNQSELRVVVVGWAIGQVVGDRVRREDGELHTPWHHHLG